MTNYGGKKRSKKASKKNMKRSAKRTMKKSKKTGKKRKPTPYINFMKNFFKKHKGEDVKKVVKMGAAEWRKLSDAEKKKYK